MTTDSTATTTDWGASSEAHAVALDGSSLPRTTVCHPTTGEAPRRLEVGPVRARNPDDELRSAGSRTSSPRHRIGSPRVVRGPHAYRRSAAMARAGHPGLRTGWQHLGRGWKSLIALVSIPAVLAGSIAGAQTVWSTADRFIWERSLPDLPTTTTSQVLGAEVYQRGERAAMFADAENGRLTIVPLRHEPFQLRFPEEDREPGIAICGWIDDFDHGFPTWWWRNKR